MAPAKISIYLESIHSPLTNQSESQLKKAKRLAILFLASNLLVIILTIIPVVASLPTFYKTWYGLADVLRILEPVTALPFHLLIFIETGVVGSRLGWIPVSIFAVFAAIYQQGSGFHSASNMLKNAFGTLTTNGASQAYPVITEIYSWTRDTWEHLVSHYLYAAGGILLAGLYAVLFSRFIITEGIKDFWTRVLWVMSAISYGVIIGAVAIEFPSGSIVAFCLIGLWGFIGCGLMLWQCGGRRAFTVFGYCIVLQYFIAAYSVALVIVCTWVGVSGFTSKNQQSS